MLKLHFKNNKHNDVPLDKARMSIGREANNQVVIDSPGISGFHAEIHCENGQAYLVDLGSTNGCQVNGKLITGKHKLKPWDTITLDQVEIEVVDTESRRPTMVSRAISDTDLQKATTGPAGTQVRKAVGEWLLVGESGLMAGKQIPLSGKTVVGRESDCDLSINSNEVSSRHAELELSSGQVRVKDLNSTNGTFVNDRRVTEAVLQVGDIIKFDQQSFKLNRLGDSVNKTAVRSAVDIDSKATQTRENSHAPVNETKVPVMVGTTGQRHALKREMSIGRSDDNDMVLDDITVSTRHARISKEGDSWFVEDLGSTNGTFINDKKVTRQVLQAGDQVRFGKIAMRYELPGNSSRNGTQVISAISDDAVTRTSVMAAKKQPLPPWAYGLLGFFVVGLGFSAFLFRDSLGIGKPKQIEADLQASTVWAKTLPTTATGIHRSAPTTPLIADVNGDKVLDVVIGDAQGFMLALDGKTGKKIFDVHVKDKVLAPPVAADFSGNGIAEVVVATNGGLVKAINGEGKDLWVSSRELELGGVWNRPVLHDLNDDGVLDVVVPSQKKGLVGLDGSRGWQLWNTGEFTNGQVVTTPATADINGDHVTDFVFATDQRQILAVSAQKDRVWRLWEAKTPGKITYASPLFLNVGERGLIVVLTDVGPVAFYADNGRQAWGAELRKRFFASPIGVDGNGDGVPDVVAVAENGDVHVFDSLTGDEIWSAALGVEIQASPSAFDVDDDGLADLVILDKAGRMLVLNMARGRPVLSIQAAKPVMTSQGEKTDGFIASPVMGDLTGDGLIEIVTASLEGQVTSFGLNRTVRKGKAVWPVFLGNDTHSVN